MPDRIFIVREDGVIDVYRDDGTAVVGSPIQFRGGFAHTLVRSPGGNALYVVVSGPGGHRLVRVSPRTLRIEATSAPLPGFHAIAVSADSMRIYVVTVNSPLLELDAATLQATRNAPGGYGTAITISASTGRIYVANEVSRQVFAMDMDPATLAPGSNLTLPGPNGYQGKVSVVADRRLGEQPNDIDVVVLEYFPAGELRVHYFDAGGAFRRTLPTLAVGSTWCAAVGGGYRALMVGSERGMAVALLRQTGDWVPPPGADPGAVRDIHTMHGYQYLLYGDKIAKTFGSGSSPWNQAASWADSLLRYDVEAVTEGALWTLKSREIDDRVAQLLREARVLEVDSSLTRSATWAAAVAANSQYGVRRTGDKKTRAFIDKRNGRIGYADLIDYVATDDISTNEAASHLEATYLYGSLTTGGPVVEPRKGALRASRKRKK